MEMFEGTFWTRFDELIEDLQSEGLEVADYNREYVTVFFEDEEYVIYLAGTERTIVIESYEEI